MEVLIRALMEAGLSGEEAKVYAALIRLGEATAREVAEEAKIPTTHVYEALSALLSRGLVSLTDTRPRRYCAKMPEHFIRKSIEEKVNSLRNIMDMAIKTISQIRVNSMNRSQCEVMMGRGIVDFIESFLEKPRRNIYALIGDLSEKVETRILDNIVKASKRGAKVKLALQASKALPQSVMNPNFEVRYIEVAPPGLLIIADDEAVLVPDAQSMSTCVVFRGDIVKRYLEYYHHVWVEHYLHFMRRARAMRIDELY
ncbi:MAG: hypothetical protein DRN15_08555 [Thermoprotei archaeon]|nr:MAG: hypothetical protein DRM97_06285 [Thermoprotei archaeon]RLF22631.1 MAG: hypothetical protein DRN15_08555 [Thermoprotei archaeon]